MAAPIAFVSKRKLDEKRDEKRKAQKVILEKAKQKFEREEKKRKLIKERGDDKWMLPSVSDALDVQSAKKKKRKKEKKEKKRNKKSKKKSTKRNVSRDEESSSSGDDSDEEEWVEAAPSVGQPPPSIKGKQHSNTDTSDASAPITSEAKPLQRDNWMESPFLTATYSSSDIRKEREEKRKEEKIKQSEYNSVDNPGQSARELNPFWKNGGTGLPEEDPSKGKATTQPVGVGDKGVSWLRKSYERVKQQAEEEGRPFEVLAAERWGSLEKIHKMLAEAEGSRYPRSENSPSWRKSGNDERYSRRDGGHRSGYSERDRYRGRGSEDRDKRDSDSSQRWKKSERDESRGDRDSERNSDSKGDRHRGGHSRDRYESPGKGRGMFRKPNSDEDNDTLVSARSSKTESLLNSMRTKFKKPGEEDGDSYSRGEQRKSSSSSTGNWRKPGFEKSSRVVSPSQTSKSLDKKELKEEVSRSASDDESGSFSSSSEEEADEVPKVKVLTKDEMNQLGAKVVKAEIMGNQKLVEELKKQLEMARQAAANQPKPEARRSLPSKERQEEREEEVILSRTNKMGQSFPLPEESGYVERGGKKKKKRKGVETHNKEGLRERYFGDDDNMDLKTMVQKEKMGLAEDQNNLFSRAQARALKSLNEEYTLDDMFVSSANKQSSREEAQKQRDRAIREHQKMEASLSRCPYCINSPEMQKHLIVALGVKVYLCLPRNQSLTRGHCLIVPMQHSTAGTAVDEDVWNEMQMFRKGLTKMLADREEDAVFLEYSLTGNKQRHLCIECIPLPKEEGDMAPMYFKKAIQESETEWSQNKKLIDTRKKDIRHSVPKGFPYFSVDFGMDGGFAHVIEDEQLFPHYFGKEILGGMLNLEPQLWRRPHKENFDSQRKKVLEFAEQWKPFDWTKNIDRETT